METEKVLKLIDAGFTADEIRSMIQPAADPEEKPAEVPEEQPAAPEEKPAEKAPESVNDIFMNELNKTLEKMNETLRDIQTANIRHSKGQQPESPVDIASDILAEVIAPQKGKKNER